MAPAVPSSLKCGERVLVAASFLTRTVTTYAATSAGVSGQELPLCSPIKKAVQPEGRVLRRSNASSSCSPHGQVLGKRTMTVRALWTMRAAVCKSV